MANRPVFSVKESRPFYRELSIDFSFNSGFSASQKQKNIMALHKGYRQLYPEHQVLEISSKSLQPLGKSLSAFSLDIFVPSLGERRPVECVFQSSKVFSGGGPYEELLECTPREAKKDERIRSSGELTGFRFEGTDYPTIPRTIFYDWIYTKALMEHDELSKQLITYQAFTDIEFNPQKSINCQAKAAAVYVSLVLMGIKDQITDFGSFRSLFI